MDVTRCPHCGIHVAPTANGECPSCRRSIAATPANIAEDNERPQVAKAQLVAKDPAWQFHTLSLLLGGLWIIAGVGLIAISSKDPYAAIWGLALAGLGVLICLKKLWAVRVGLGISYWLILRFIFVVRSFPELPMIFTVLLGHCVLNRARKIGAHLERPTKELHTDE